MMGCRFAKIQPACGRCAPRGGPRGSQTSSWISEPSKPSSGQLQGHLGGPPVQANPGDLLAGADAAFASTSPRNATYPRTRRPSPRSLGASAGVFVRRAIAIPARI
jgi:hypothetical protein